MVLCLRLLGRAFVDRHFSSALLLRFPRCLLDHLLGGFRQRGFTLDIIKSQFALFLYPSSAFLSLLSHHDKLPMLLHDLSLPSGNRTILNLFLRQPLSGPLGIEILASFAVSRSWLRASLALVPDGAWQRRGGAFGYRSQNEHDSMAGRIFCSRAP